MEREPQQKIGRSANRTKMGDLCGPKIKKSHSKKFHAPPLSLSEVGVLRNLDSVYQDALLPGMALFYAS